MEINRFSQIFSNINDFGDENIENLRKEFQKSLLEQYVLLMTLVLDVQELALEAEKKDNTEQLYTYRKYSLGN